MGAVLCKEHGRQIGALCCDHVADAVYGRSLAIDFSIVILDIFGDKSEELKHYLCKKCIQKYGLPKNGCVSENVWSNDDAFPYVYPVCGKCFREYTERQ